MVVNQLFGRLSEKVWVSELFHHQELLCVSSHSLLGKPSGEFLLIGKFLIRDATVPVIQTFTSLLFQDTNPHLPVVPPVARLFCDGSSFPGSIYRFFSFHGWALLDLMNLRDRPL